MLILSRKPGESIVIGTDVVVKVLSVEGEKVRIGIAAPDSVRVLREELLRGERGGGDVADPRDAD